MARNTKILLQLNGSKEELITTIKFIQKKTPSWLAKLIAKNESLIQPNIKFQTSLSTGQLIVLPTYEAQLLIVANLGLQIPVLLTTHAAQELLANFYLDPFTSALYKFIAAVYGFHSPNLQLAKELALLDLVGQEEKAYNPRELLFNVQQKNLDNIESKFFPTSYRGYVAVLREYAEWQYDPNQLTKIVSKKSYSDHCYRGITQVGAAFAVSDNGMAIMFHNNNIRVFQEIKLPAECYKHLLLDDEVQAHSKYGLDYCMKEILKRYQYTQDWDNYTNLIQESSTEQNFVQQITNIISKLNQESFKETEKPNWIEWSDEQQVYVINQEMLGNYTGPLWVPRLDSINEQVVDENNRPIHDLLYYEKGQVIAEKSFIAPESSFPTEGRCTIEESIRKYVLEVHKNIKISQVITKFFKNIKSTTSDSKIITAIYEAYQALLSYPLISKLEWITWLDHDRVYDLQRMPTNFTGPLFFPRIDSQNQIVLDDNNISIYELVYYENGKLIPAKSILFLNQNQFLNRHCTVDPKTRQQLLHDHYRDRQFEIMLELDKDLSSAGLEQTLIIKAIYKAYKIANLYDMDLANLDWVVWNDNDRIYNLKWVPTNFTGPLFFPRVYSQNQIVTDGNNIHVYDLLYYESGKLVPERSIIFLSNRIPINWHSTVDLEIRKQFIVAYYKIKWINKQLEVRE